MASRRAKIKYLLKSTHSKKCLEYLILQVSRYIFILLNSSAAFFEATEDAAKRYRGARVYLPLYSASHRARPAALRITSLVSRATYFRTDVIVDLRD